jgi:hypothetical protein
LHFTVPAAPCLHLFILLFSCIYCLLNTFCACRGFLHRKFFFIGISKFMILTNFWWIESPCSGQWWVAVVSHIFDGFCLFVIALYITPVYYLIEYT